MPGTCLCCEVSSIIFCLDSEAMHEHTDKSLNKIEILSSKILSTNHGIIKAKADRRNICIQVILYITRSTETHLFTSGINATDLSCTHVMYQPNTTGQIKLHS